MALLLLWPDHLLTWGVPQYLSTVARADVFLHIPGGIVCVWYSGATPPLDML